MSTAFCDIADSNFIGDRDIQNNPLPSDPTEKENDLSCDIFMIVMKPFSFDKTMKGRPEDEWELRHILSAGSFDG